MVVQPGPVINFLLANQNVNHPNYLDWNKVHHLILCCSILADVLLSLRSVLNYLTFPHQARRALKNLRVKVAPSNREYKITGLSEERCKYQMYVVIWCFFYFMFTSLWVLYTISLFDWYRFTMNSKNEKGELEEVQITVYHYFTEIRGLKLEYSGDFPCINVGKPKRPTYIPIEVTLVHCYFILFVFMHGLIMLWFFYIFSTVNLWVYSVTQNRLVVFRRLPW